MLTRRLLPATAAMLTRRLLPIVLLALGACGPPRAIIQQSGPPSRLAGAPALSIETDLSALMVDNGETYAQEMAERSPEEQASLGEAFIAMDAALRGAFAGDIGIPVSPAMAPPQPGEVRLTIRYVFLDPGKYAFIYARDTQLTTRLVFSVGGQVVDEIETTVSVHASVQRPAIIQRMQIVGETTGRFAGRFFQSEQTR